MCFTFLYSSKTLREKTRDNNEYVWGEGVLDVSELRQRTEDTSDLFCACSPISVNTNISCPLLISCSHNKLYKNIVWYKNKLFVHCIILSCNIHKTFFELLVLVSCIFLLHIISLFASVNDPVAVSDLLTVNGILSYLMLSFCL